MKKIFFISFLIASITAQSQSLEQNIPSNSAMVFEMNTPSIVNAVPFGELQKSSYGKQMIDGLSELVGQEVGAFGDLGIVTTSSSFIFTDQNDSQLVLVYLFPIQDAGIFENMLESKDYEIQDAGSHKYAFSPSGKSYQSSNGYYEEDVVVEEEVVVEEPMEVTEEMMEDSPDMGELEEEMVEPVYEEEQVYEEQAYAAEDEYDTEQAYEYPDYYGYNEYQEPRNEQRTLFSWNANTLTIVQSFGSSAEVQMSQNYLSPTLLPISVNTSYLKQKDPEAALSLWVSDISNSIPGLMEFVGEMNMDFSSKMVSSTYKGYKSANMKLYLEPTETRLTSEFNFNDELGKAYQKISKQKYNSDFFKYVDLENCLAYFSSNTNVENLLTEYPKILSNQFASIEEEQPYMDEVDLGMSLFFTLLDEEAVGEIIRGDILFVFSDYSNKEVEYTDYEYDSNYTAIPVIKTKMEKVPEFIVMASTKEGELTDKTMNYMEKKGLIQRQGDFYKYAAGGGLPFELYFMIKNDIFFIGTSQEQFSAISTGTYDAKVPRSFKKHIKKSQAAFYADITKAESYLEADDFSSEEKYTQMKELAQNSPTFIATGEKFKKNKAKASVIINTADGYDSGITYLLNVIEELK